MQRLRTALDEAKTDALLVTDPFNRRYLSGFTGSSGMLLVDRDTARLATDFRYYEQAEAQCTDFQVVRSERDTGSWFKDLITPMGGKKVAFESLNVSVDFHRQMREIVGDLPAADRAELVPTTNVVEGIRIIKEPEEIAALERVVALGDAAFENVARRVEPGWTEKQVAWEIEQYIRTHGGDALSFPTIVAAGPNGAMPHARAGDTVLESGQGVVIDMGALMDGYCSDMTRTIFLGDPDGAFARIYDIVLTAQLTAEELIEDGMTGDIAHKLAHTVIEQAGHGEQFGHGLGHGIGLQVH
ncbi:MAG: aminopeptidase P family protein, partial [Chloroflexi bacterium]|nr:aminopeptidase P family protein [Chloroflexota bacterium]